MRKAKFYSRTGFFISILLVIFLFAVGAAKVNESVSEVPYRCGGADLILIDTLDTMGSLERPPVVFFHSRHTEVLLKSGRDCTSCHMAEDDFLSPKFKRLTDVNRKTVMQIYHTNCIGCHNDMVVSHEKSGPVTCGGCHDLHQECESFWEAIEFDKYLHFTHVKSNDEKCEFCHHEYDKKTEKLIYKKGNEGHCAYCHGEETFEKVISLKGASHKSCIGCHRDKKSKHMDSGPVDCLGCHDSSMRKFTKKLQDVPRMDCGQPNEVLVKTGFKKVGELGCSTCMQLVPFDHKSHEQYNNTCIACHHASLESCTSCHKNVGNESGKHIRLSDAMHSVDNESSCVGCHKSIQKEMQCAGCHLSSSVQNDHCESSCNGCHVIPVSTELVNRENEVQCQNIAEEVLKSRSLDAKIYDKEDIPETVTIDSLAKQYEPVHLPHRKIVLSLIDQIKDSKLATHFHGDQSTICLGCHHNSPTSEKPPACGNCHGDSVNVSIPFKPRLVSAYHQQCIGCHDTMGLEKPESRNCGGCHAKKDVRDTL